MGKDDSKQSVKKILEENKEFIIIALTGKVKSGTTDVSRLLTDRKFCDRVTKPADTSEIPMIDARERNLCYRYLHHNWKPFVEINVAVIIFSFFMQSEKSEMEKVKWDSDDIISVINSCFNEKTFKRKVRDNIEKLVGAIEWNNEESEEEICSACGELLKQINSFDDLYCMWEALKLSLEKEDGDSKLLCFCYGVLPVVNQYLQKKLGDLYTEFYQYLGNNIRAYGKAFLKGEYISDGIFAIPRRINHFIKLLRHFKKQDGAKSNQLYIVINDLKNVFEAFYFRCRYSSFYLLAVTCDEMERRKQFKSDLLYKQAELNENLRIGKKVFQRIEKYRKEKKLDDKYDDWDNKDNIKDHFNDEEIEFMRNIYSEKGNLRRDSYRNGMASFVLQDVVKCIENADLFLTRNFHEPDGECDYKLIWPLGRMITLMMHPGILTPTKEEKCMQVAMTAKLNSGCLSRQVGAVVTDSEYNILSLGWNDAPCGAESCIRRNLFDLFRNHDEGAYSEYELYDPEFRKYIKQIEKVFDENRKQGLQGLPFAFCFKDIYQNIIQQKDQIYTRALHGEERALSMCENEKVKGGNLFTTSSPCELCAKKIKEAGIKKVYYIEQYKGISQTHIINIGKNRAEFILFTGATGLAYVKFYTPLMPYKDELKSLGYEPGDIYKETRENPVIEEQHNVVRKKYGEEQPQQERQD